LPVYLREIAVFIQSKRLQNQRYYRHHWFHYTELKSGLVMTKTHIHTYTYAQLHYSQCKFVQ